MKDTIVAALASTPDRLEQLEGTVEALRKQRVDAIRVYLNDYEEGERPDFLSPEEVVFANEADGYLGDAGRFYWLNREIGRQCSHYFTVGHQLIYPPNYIAAMCAAFDVRGRRAIVGVQGSIFAPDGSDTGTLQVYDRLNSDRAVHMLNTAATLLSRRLIDLSIDDLRAPNANPDLPLAIAAQRQGVPMVDLARREHWIGKRELEAAEECSAEEGRTAAQIPLSRIAVAGWRLYKDPLVKRAEENAGIIGKYELGEVFTEPVPEGGFDRQVEALNAELGGELFVMVVGAMNGVDYDGLRKHLVNNPQWRGLLIEPLPDIMAELKANYEGRDNLLFEEVAITEEDGTAEITRIPVANVGQECPKWSKGIGTLKPDKHIIGHRDELTPYAVKETVTTTTFKTLVEKYGDEFSNIHILQIDAEGYDYEIFKQVWDEKFMPRIIKIEINYFTITDLREIKALLKTHGYKCFFDFDDLIAVKS